MNNTKNLKNIDDIVLAKHQANIKITQDDKIGDIWNIIENSEIQEKLNTIFEKVISARMTKFMSGKFNCSNYIDEIRIDCCGRDFKMYSDIRFDFQGAWDDEESKKRDLCYLGINLYKKYYRYHAKLNKAQCQLDVQKQRYSDNVSNLLGYKYLTDNYGWLFNQNQEGIWTGYDKEKEMYLFLEIDISNYTISELNTKIQYDLGQIYTYINEFCK